jgi:glyoxylase-like metal-dependent hydrolase (beta-lactamase superfamily II)
VFEAIVREVHQDGMTFDVRCFLLPHATGVLLIDTGLPGTTESIGEGLDRIGATWSDITDIVLTHNHFDHVAGLADVVRQAGALAIWAGTEDRAGIPFDGKINALEHAERVRGLEVIATPGHTRGHRSLIHDDVGLLFAGDIAGSMGGVMTRGPEQFTADATEALRTLAAVARLPWERVIFSHGDEVSDPRADLQRLLAERDTPQP